MICYVPAGVWVVRRARAAALCGLELKRSMGGKRHDDSRTTHPIYPNSSSPTIRRAIRARVAREFLSACCRL